MDLAVNRQSHQDYVDWIHSEYTERMLNALCRLEQYDFVIMDTPPISAAADVTKMLSFADRTLLVVRTDYVSVKDVNDVILDIKETGGNLAGCILNDVHRWFFDFGTGKNGYSYGRYGRYGGYYRQNTHEK